MAARGDFFWFFFAPVSTLSFGRRLLTWRLQSSRAARDADGGLSWLFRRLGNGMNFFAFRMEMWSRMTERLCANFRCLSFNANTRGISISLTLTFTLASSSSLARHSRFLLIVVWVVNNNVLDWSGGGCSRVSILHSLWQRQTNSESGVINPDV